MSWKLCKDFPPPRDRYFIALIEDTSWLCIAKFIREDPPYIIYETPHGFICMGSPTWWHEVPERPNLEFANQENWFSCEYSPPPSNCDSAVEFILYDEEVGTAAAEFRSDSYITDVFSCKVLFRKPLYWRPFPRLPVHYRSKVLQWDVED